MKNKIDEFNDEDFIKIISTSSLWTEISIKLGYQKGISSSLKEKVKNRCDNLNIRYPETSKPSVNQKTKGELFLNRKNWQSARTAIRKAAQAVFDKSNKPKLL